MTTDAKVLAEMVGLAPADPALYLACRVYVQRFDGDNNPDPETNGEYDMLRATIPACRTVFDVGAHVGGWSEAVVKLNPQVALHAFEPGAKSFAALAQRGLPAGVRLNRLALGATSEQRALYSFGGHQELSSLYAREAIDGYPVDRSDASETVTVTTLDAYCAQHGVAEIDFLKIDAEGHDLQVLRGGRGMLARRAVGIVQFEYGAANIDSRDLLKDFFDFFAELSYDLLKVRQGGFAPFARYDARLENFTYQNWIAARRK